jgi:anaerobic selenocysteine-containing dehydrogenase
VACRTRTWQSSTPPAGPPNEAAFLFNIFAREYGTNNFPDCSNMCHEATSVGLPKSIGIGKGTVSLEDFDHCELIIAMGHNPGTNHPRMMGTLHECSRRGVPIIVFNPLKERALERFADPQNPIEMGTFRSTPIASTYYQVKVGGDAAALKGIMKAIMDAAETNGDALDHGFIAEHTNGFAEFAADWADIERACGLTRAELARVAAAYIRSKATIVTYGMGITQHAKGTQNVQQIAALLMLRGNFGKRRWHLPSVTKYGDSASVQAVTRVNAEQTSKRTMRRPTRQPFRARLSGIPPGRCIHTHTQGCAYSYFIVRNAARALGKLAVQS